MLLALVLFSAPGVLLAEAVSPTRPIQVEIVAVRGDTVIVRAKSPRRALLLSGAGMLAMGVPVVNLAAIPFGPALGHFYAGNHRQAWTGVGIRLGAIVGATVLVAGRALNGAPGAEEDMNRYLIGAVAVILVSGAYDVATAPASARRYNERAAGGVRMSVLPIVGAQRGVRLGMRM